jgi:phage baseplate assembly protein gpV
VTKAFTTPEDCVSIRLWFYGSTVGVTYYDDIAITATSYVSYAVTRDGGTDYSADSNPAWKAGQAVVNYGASGDGGILLDGSGTPELSIFTHAGAPWTTITDHVSLTPTLTKFGSDVSAAGSTALAVMHSAQTYNSESLGAGDVLLGDNTAGKANILWDKSAGQILFRGGSTTQGYIAVDGSAMFGAGAVVLNVTGVNIIAGSDTFNKLMWWSDGDLDEEYASAGSSLTLEGSSEGCTALMLIGGNGTDISAPLLPYGSVYMEARGEDSASTGYAKAKARLLSAKEATDEVFTIWTAQNGNYGAYLFNLDRAGTIDITGNLEIDGTKVVSNRVVDARCDDSINSGDATTDGVIDALRDAMIAHGLIAAAA